MKTRFEAVNPALKADADSVDEMRAEEITANLRPNPQFNTTVDGTEIAPNDGHWQPLAGNLRRTRYQLPARARPQARVAPEKRAGRYTHLPSPSMRT